MTVPTPTVEYLDFNTSPFTKAGFSAEADDQHGTDVTGDLDQVNDWYTSTVSPISTGGNHSITGWVYVEAGATGANNIFSQQHNSPTGSVYQIYQDAGTDKLLCEWSGSSGNRLRAQTSNGSVPKSTWIHFACTVNGTENLAASSKIYILGVEEAAYTEQAKAGTGFTGPGGTLPKLTVGALRPSGTQLLKGKPSRCKFWEGTILTADEILEEYNCEVTLITGSCDVTAPVSLFLDESLFKDKLFDEDLFQDSLYS